jgi:hypothetical protein
VRQEAISLQQAEVTEQHGGVNVLLLPKRDVFPASYGSVHESEVRLEVLFFLLRLGRPTALQGGVVASS